MTSLVRFSTPRTSRRDHMSTNSGEASLSRRTSSFQAGSPTWSAMLSRYWSTMRDIESSHSTIERRQTGLVNPSHSVLRSSTGTRSRSLVSRP